MAQQMQKTASRFTRRLLQLAPNAKLTPKLIHAIFDRFPQARGVKTRGQFTVDPWNHNKPLPYETLLPRQWQPPGSYKYYEAPAWFVRELEGRRVRDLVQPETWSRLDDVKWRLGLGSVHRGAPYAAFPRRDVPAAVADVHWLSRADPESALVGLLHRTDRFDTGGDLTMRQFMQENPHGFSLYKGEPSRDMTRWAAEDGMAVRMTGTGWRNGTQYDIIAA